MMGFLFGLMIGSSLASGSAPEARQMLSQIPLRCLYLVDDPEQYDRCRYPSMQYEFKDRWVEECEGIFDGSSCKKKFVKQNIQWELAALKQLANAAAKQKQ